MQSKPKTQSSIGRVTMAVCILLLSATSGAHNAADGCATIYPTAMPDIEILSREMATRPKVTWGNCFTAYDTVKEPNAKNQSGATGVRTTTTFGCVGQDESTRRSFTAYIRIERFTATERTAERPGRAEGASSDGNACPAIPKGSAAAYLTTVPD